MNQGFALFLLPLSRKFQKSMNLRSKGDISVSDTQLSNLWWISNSVSKGVGTAMKTGSSRQFKRYPTTYRWVSSWLPLIVDSGLSWFILILSKWKLTWNSHIGCLLSFKMSSWWACSHGSSATTYADYRLWHSLDWRVLSRIELILSPCNQIKPQVHKILWWCNHNF